MATKNGQRMTTEQRVKRLMPHEMTTRLFEEMANLRLKRTGAGLDIALEQINTRFPKDKYSAFAYGLGRIKELEEENEKLVGTIQKVLVEGYSKTNENTLTGRTDGGP